MAVSDLDHFLSGCLFSDSNDSGVENVPLLKRGAPLLVQAGKLSLWFLYTIFSCSRCVRFAQSQKPLKRKGSLGKWIRVQIKMENFDSSRRTRKDYLPSHFRTGHRPTVVLQHQGLARETRPSKGKHFVPEFGRRVFCRSVLAVKMSL